jgi:cytochrome c
MRVATSFITIGASSVFATLLLGPIVGDAAGIVTAGQHDFALCARCHSSAPGVNMRGPSLAGIVGRKSGVAVGYKYSAAMAVANLTWDDATLDKFLAGPRRFVPGTRMSVSVASGAERQDIIAYLNTLK